MRKRGRTSRFVKQFTRKGRETLRLEAEIETCESNERVLKHLLGEAKRHKVRRAERNLEAVLMREAMRSIDLKKELEGIEKPRKL